MGGGLVKNLGYFSVPALIVLVVLAVVGWRWWGRRSPATQPSSSST
jgi:predicted negative regulator of RcsB-dependent stress response